MPYRFSSSRISKGNTIFPITIAIEEHHLHYYKGFIVGQSRISIPKANIVSIGLVDRIMFSDVIIETKGGHVVFLNGFSHVDARRIYNLLNNGGQINRS